MWATGPWGSGRSAGLASSEWTEAPGPLSGTQHSAETQVQVLMNNPWVLPAPPTARGGEMISVTTACD